MCGSHYSIRGHYPYALYGYIHLQLNTFISPFQHKFVEKPRFALGRVAKLATSKVGIPIIEWCVY